MRKILMLIVALAFSFIAAQRTASAALAPQCNCSFCGSHPSAFCDIRSFHTSCAAYYPNFCEDV